ncbi:MAG: histidine phosphatase family protein [Candidatus Izemoplasmatales bacterium]|jgi:broad specificity phosphatase PhoE|nr:histidine phosphatase family protein [Candidatus Izemoplasmatales bacterium]
MNEIYLVRHGETDANRNYVVQGRMDNPLNEFGKKQAFETGEFFLHNKMHFDLVISSPLKRAFETAKIINQAMRTSKPIIVHQDLIERNFGDYDGQKITDEYADLIKRGTIPHMELNPDLEKRIFGALTELCKKYPNKKMLIVTHSHVIKAVLVHLVPDFNYGSYLFNCSINHILYKNRKFESIQHNINPFDLKKL